MTEQLLRRDCWCYAAKKQVWIRERIIAHRQADVMQIQDCQEKNCPLRYSPHCLIGKRREAAW